MKQDAPKVLLSPLHALCIIRDYSIGASLEAFVAGVQEDDCTQLITQARASNKQKQDVSSSKIYVQLSLP